MFDRIVLILMACFLPQVSCTENAKESKTNGNDTTVNYQALNNVTDTIDDKVVVIDSFLDFFPDLVKLPTIETLEKITFNYESELSEQFGNRVITDYYVENAYYYKAQYQPIGKYRFRETNYLLFFAEKIGHITRIKIWVSYDHGREMGIDMSGIPDLLQFRDAEIEQEPDPASFDEQLCGKRSVGFEFISNKVDSVKVYFDRNKRISNLYVLEPDNCAGYHNMSKLVKLTNKTIIPIYSFNEFCGLFPQINADWNSEKEINKLQYKGLKDAFSLFLHQKTIFVNAYKGDSINYVDRYSPLGYRKLKDNLHLFVLYDHYAFFDDTEIKILLVRDFETMVSELNLTYEQYHQTKFNLSDNLLNFTIDRNIEGEANNYNIKVRINDSGFLPERESFKQWLKTKISKSISFKQLYDCSLVKDGLFEEVYSLPKRFIISEPINFVGYVETQDYYVLVNSQVQDIINDSGEVLGVYAYVFDKKNMAFVKEIVLAESEYIDNFDDSLDLFSILEQNNISGIQ